MGDNKNVIHLADVLNDANYLKRLKNAIGQIIYTNHAIQRMEERDITSVMINRCLLNGCIDEPAHLDVHGNWKATISHITSGERIKVAAVIKDDGKGDMIIVVTVIK